MTIILHFMLRECLQLEKSTEIETECEARKTIRISTYDEIRMINPRIILLNFSIQLTSDPSDLRVQFRFSIEPSKSRHKIFYAVRLVFDVSSKMFFRFRFY